MKKLLLLASLTACITPQPEQPVPTPEPVKPEPYKPDYPLQGWLPKYDELIKSLVTENMIKQGEAKMAKFCDVWSDLDREARKQFYADLLYAIAYPESNYNNLSMYIEDQLGKDSITGLPLVSEGLLQLSYGDVRGYPNCQFNAKKDIEALRDDLAGRTAGSFSSKHPERDTLHPVKNLSCGVHIIDKMLTRYPSVEFADMLGKYWSTARRTSPAYKKVWQKLRERKSPCE